MKSSTTATPTTELAAAELAAAELAAAELAASELAGRSEASSDEEVFVVDEDTPHDRADRAVVAILAARGRPRSRATVQRWFAEGRVLVDGASCAPSKALRVGARVAVRPGVDPASTVVPDASITLTVVDEDEHLLVIDKPAGLVVHPAAGHWEGTLVHGLLARPGFEAAALEDGAEASGPRRPGIVHRLDRGTSGLLVVAKDAPTREGLKAQFAAHTIDREYAALVVGVATDRTVDAPHGRHPKDRMRFTSFGSPLLAKRAVTHVRAVEALAGATLVTCTLETGRTHQIRVHLAERMGTPVLADPVYGGRIADAGLAAIASRLGRQALHARKLGFDHPITGQRRIFESALPPDIAAALVALRARRDGQGF